MRCFLTSKSCFAEHDYYLDFRLQKFIGYENVGYLFFVEHRFVSVVGSCTRA